MGLFLGNSEKLRITTTGGICKLIIPPSAAFSSSGVVLKSFDNYILLDSNGVYLTAKEDK